MRSLFVLIAGLGCVLPSHAVNAAEKAAPTIVLDPKLPPYRPNEHDLAMSYLTFAAASLDWIRRGRPLQAYIPPQNGKFGPVEWQLVEALHFLDKVPDSDSDRRAYEQKKQREELAYETLKDFIKTGGNIKDALGNIRKQAFEPTIVGDGQGPLRDALRTEVYDTLIRCIQKRSDKDTPRDALIKKGLEGGTPTLKNRPTDVISEADFEAELRRAEVVRTAIVNEDNGIKISRVQQYNAAANAGYTPPPPVLPPSGVEINYTDPTRSGGSPNTGPGSAPIGGRGVSGVGGGSSSGCGAPLCLSTEVDPAPAPPAQLEIRR